MDKKEVRASKDNSFGIAGVVLGIISVLFLSNGIITGIIGLVFSLKQKKLNANKWSKAGIILNVIGIILGIAMLIFLFKFSQGYLAQFQSLQGGA